MTPDIVAVLVVPAPNDPGGLLAAGRCGALPPMVMDLNGDGLWEEVDRPEDRTIPDEGDNYAVATLPLWWDGALCVEGWDRARRVLYAAPDPVHPAFDPLLHRFYPDGLDGPPTAGAEWLAVELVRFGLASRVVRLARVDGRLVEL